MTLLVRIVMFLLHNQVPHLKTCQTEVEPLEDMKKGKKGKKKKEINMNPKYGKRKQEWDYGSQPQLI